MESRTAWPGARGARARIRAFRRGRGLPGALAALLLLAAVAGPARAAADPLLVPPGKEPQIDGNVGPEEWKDALAVETPGLDVRLLAGPTHLYVLLQARREGRFAGAGVHLRIPANDRIEFDFPHDRRSLVKEERFFFLEAGTTRRGPVLRTFGFTKAKGRFVPDGNPDKFGGFVPADTGELRAAFERACGWVAVPGEAGGRPLVEVRISFWRMGIDPCSGCPERLRIAAAMAVEPPKGRPESASWPAKGPGDGWLLDLGRPWRADRVLEAAVKPRDGWIGPKPAWARDPARLRDGVLRFLVKREGTLGGMGGADLGAAAREEAGRFLAERLAGLEAGPRAAALEAATAALAPAGQGVRIRDFQPGPPGESLAEACALWELGLHKVADRVDASIRVKVWNALADLDPATRKAYEKRSMPTFDASMDWIGGAPGFGYHVLTLYEKDGRIRAQVRVSTGTWFASDDRIVVITGSESIGAPGIQDGFAMYDPDGREIVCRRDVQGVFGEIVRVIDGRFYVVTSIGILAVDREGREVFRLGRADSFEKCGGFLLTVLFTNPGFLVRVYADDGRALGEQRTKGPYPELKPVADGNTLTVLIDGKKLVFQK